MQNTPFHYELYLPTILDGEDKTSSLKNRIRKNYRHLRKWAKRTDTDSFRIYGRDIKEYPIIIDFYAGHFYVQYFSSDREHDEPPKDLQIETEEALTSIFGVSLDKIYWRSRIKRAKIEQYEKINEKKEFFFVKEYGAIFKINLFDYLDTGLFLDHRETRQLVKSLSLHKKVLNLFAYTCSFSIQAALGGASFTKSVDMSNTYTEWGADNFLLNSLPLETNQIIRADCLKFLEEEIFKGFNYDLIVVDPPTISRSKKMDQLFDIQVDYVPLLKGALNLLDKKGTLFFSTNARKFTFDLSLFPNHDIQEITAKTIPLDFHDKKIHRCWKITHKLSS